MTPRTLALVLSALLPVSAWAADGTATAADTLVRPAGDTELSSFLWVNRPIVIFADTPADPRYQEQLDKLTAEAERLVDRDVVVLTDSDPSARSPARQQLHPRGFQFVLIDKDGSVMLRKPYPYSVREVTRTIDKTPMRQREVEERRESQ
ncbi:DUF4174 domain-containing protein [Aquicoccus sp. SU-CL01552]|uniref:DUF4174 domain-containing protein n=1 Tax=Aquicoccus sp. SU-CL01552 TaxID=3127656 RepID=UPI00310B3E80